MISSLFNDKQQGCNRNFQVRIWIPYIWLAIFFISKINYAQDKRYPHILFYLIFHLKQVKKTGSEKYGGSIRRCLNGEGV